MKFHYTNSCIALWLITMLLLLLLRPVGAHPMPQSAVLLDIHPSGVSVETAPAAV